MSTVIREFSSISEVIKAIDDELVNYRKLLGDLLRRLEELRAKAEQEKKLKDLLEKLGKPPSQTATPAFELKNVKLYINPSAEVEVMELESAVESLNSKITHLQAVRKDLEVFSGVELEAKIIVIYVDGVPKSFIIKML